jgi:hypothetical protein
MRLIDADAMQRQAYEDNFDGKISDGMLFAVNWLLERAPTIDAEPVRHGKWANDAMGVLRCSECNAQAPWRFIGIMYDEVDYRWKANYCPQCGARMDEDD